MLSRSALQMVAILTSFTLCAMLWTYSSSNATRARPVHVSEKHSRSWWASTRVALSPTLISTQSSNANAGQHNGILSYKALEALSGAFNARKPDHAPSLRKIDTQELVKAQQAQPHDGIFGRCKHTLGQWCKQALSVNRTAAASPDLLGEKGCTAACNTVGNCNADTGVCDCPAGKATV